MANRISKELKADAFTLYCMNAQQSKIGKILMLKPATINRWVMRGGWVQKRDEINRQYKEASGMSIKEQDLALLGIPLSIYAKSVQEGRAEVSTRDMLETIKVRRLVMGLSTENLAQNVKQTIVVSYDREKPKTKVANVALNRESAEENEKTEDEVPVKGV